VRLASAGTRTDRLRVALTALGAALTTFLLLAAATVQWLPATEARHVYWDGEVELNFADRRYTSLILNDTRARPYLVAVLLLLAITTIVFAAQSARLGAPARDRRLAALRLAGATPGQARLVIAAETSFAGLVGALAGIGGYFAIRPMAEHRVMGRPWADLPLEWIPPPRPLLVLPTDALPPAWVFVALVVAVPVIAAVLSLVALRRVSVSPLEVTRRVPRRRLHWWPFIFLLLGIGLTEVEAIANMNAFGGPLPPAVGWAAIVFMAVGIALSGAPIGQLAARLVVRYARRPAPLLAARRILADPWHGGRNFGVLLVATGFGALGVTVLAILRAEFSADRPLTGNILTDTGTHVVAVGALVGALLAAGAGLLCALVDGTLARRRTLVTLVAAGTPRSVLVRVVAWQALLPAVPAVVLALVVGYAAPRLAAGPLQDLERRPIHVPVPWHDLAMVGLGGLVTVGLAVALSLPALRASTDPAELRTE
jgi:hypothetical protein